MSNFASVIRRVQENLNRNNIYSIYYKFTIGGLELSSTGENLFVSFEYNKNGSGCANTFTISLAFVPKPGHDPNRIDKMLATAEDDGCKISLQYGYSSGNGFTILSPKYEGLATDYNIEIRDGMLYYTITGYSSLITDTETKLSFDEVGQLNGDTLVGGQKPTVQVYNKMLEVLGSQYNIKNEVKNQDIMQHIPRYDSVTIFEYAKEVLASAKSNITGDINSGNRITYTFIVDDSIVNGKKSIIIKDIDPSASKSAEFKFNWMDKYNSMVLNFIPDFKGAIPLSIKKAESEDEGTYTINNKGEVVLVDKNGSSSSSSHNKLLNRWASATQYSYTATLTLVGIPCEIPIGSIIEVIPLIYGVKHHTAGKYMITGVSDIIDTGGYQTVLKLMKIVN